MKTHRYILFIIACVLSIGTGWGFQQRTYYYKFTAKTSTGKTTEGSVYASTSNTPPSSGWGASKEVSGNEKAWTAPSINGYLFAKPANNYKLDHWTDSDGNTINAGNPNPDGIFISNISVTGKTGSATNVTYTAYFTKLGTLHVTSDEGGAAYVDKIDNTQGNVVNLSAYNLYDYTFAGWEVNGSIVSTNKNISVTVPSTEVTYKATWTKKTVSYYRLRNQNGYYLSIVGNQGSELSHSSSGKDYFDGFKLDGTIKFTNTNVTTNPSTILKITSSGYATGVYSTFDIEAQGLTLSSILKADINQVSDLSMTETFSLVWDGKDGYKIRNRDEGLFIQSVGSSTDGYFVGTTYSYANNDTWYFEPVDDEHIATNYFEVTADPNLDIVDNNGVTHHYCSLYVTFPFKCSTGMSAYYVTEIKDDVAECNTDGIQNVAANTPVILEWTGSNKIVPINIAENIPHAVESDAIDNNQWKGQIDLYTSKSNNTPVLNTVTYDQGKMRVLTAQEVAGNKTVLLGKNTTLTKIPSNSAYLDYPNAREYYIVIFPLELIETEGEIKNINTKVGSVHVIRSFTGGTDGGWGNWNTFVVPFDMTLDDVEAQFGEAEVKELSSFFITGEGDESTLHLRYSDATGIECGKPYIVRTKANVADITMKDINVNTTKDPVQTLTSDGYKLYFQGSYVYLDGTTGTNYVPRDAFIINKNLYYYVDSNVKMKGFRAYLSPKANDPAKAPIKAMKFAEGEPTAISNICIEGLEDGAIYNTQGIRLNNIQRGINIVNGKKIIR